MILLQRPVLLGELAVEGGGLSRLLRVLGAPPGGVVAPGGGTLGLELGALLSSLGRGVRLYIVYHIYIYIIYICIQEGVG